MAWVPKSVRFAAQKRTLPEPYPTTIGRGIRRVPLVPTGNAPLGE
jgi:hypothetical protein